MEFWTPKAAGVNKVASVPSPVGGLNARDSIVAMPETDALVMQNWWPQPYGCTIRKGSRKWVTDFPDPVNSLAAWADVDGTQMLFAWGGTDFYDASTAGTAGTALISGLTNDIWESVVLNNAAGNALIALNGFDDAILYTSGGGAQRIVAGDGIVANTWAGISPQSAVCPTIHQHRLWVVEDGTSNGWFLPPDQRQGTFVKYDFGPLFSKGGFLQFLITWTLDDGSGATDHLIAVSSRGEAVVYQGTDPTDDTKWSLRGVYFIGAPVAGRRGFCKVAGDVYIVTQQGVVSMGNCLTSTKVTQAQDRFVSDKIQFLLSELIANYSDLFGWDMKYFPKYNMLIVNIPAQSVGSNVQLACNQITGSWTEFRNMDASCWCAFGSTPMFADYSGNVMVGWAGNLDYAESDGTGGQMIVAAVQQAYSYAGAPATQKQVGMYRPVFIVGNVITIASQIQYDFTEDYIAPVDPAPITFSSLWGVGLWGTSTWGGGTQVQRGWIQAGGMGVAASIRMVIQCQTDVLWVSTDYSFISGSGLL